MTLSDSDPRFTPRPIRIARPLFRAFAASRICPARHRWHASTTLPVLALFVAMTSHFDDEGLSWGSLDPDALVSASLEIDGQDYGFLQDLLDASASFYAFLGEHGEVPFATADRISARLTTLSLGFYALAA